MGSVFRHCTLLLLTLMVAGVAANFVLRGQAEFWFGSLFVIGPATIMWSRSFHPAIVGVVNGVLAAIATHLGADSSNRSLVSAGLTGVVTAAVVGAMSLKRHDGNQTGRTDC